MDIRADTVHGNSGLLKVWLTRFGDPDELAPV